MAEACARLWLGGGPVDLVLVGRDGPRTERVGADLRVRSPQSDIGVVVTDFREPQAIRSMVDAIAAAGPLDIVLIAHGSLPDQSACQNDLALCADTLMVNGVSPVLYAEAFAGHMARAGRGTLALIGSVAGDRGRKFNYVYGSAKGLVTRYAQGLQNRFAGTGVKVVLVKPGPTDTPMTAELKAKGKRLATLENVAGDIVEAVRSGKPLVYTPGKWRLIMWIVRHVPAAIFNKLNF